MTSHPNVTATARTDEAIGETITANEQTFTKAGRRFG